MSTLRFVSGGGGAGGGQYEEDLLTFGQQRSLDRRFQSRTVQVCQHSSMSCFYRTKPYLCPYGCFEGRCRKHLQSVGIELQEERIVIVGNTLLPGSEYRVCVNIARHTLQFCVRSALVALHLLWRTSLSKCQTQRDTWTKHLW